MAEKFEDWLRESDTRENRCFICNLPPEVRAEVERAWVELGAREKLLTPYLTAQGYPPPRNGAAVFQYHFRKAAHHERTV